MRSFVCALAGAGIVISSPALAGEEILYQPAPDWVKPVDVDAAVARNESLTIYDRQDRIDNGMLLSYSDIAFKIESPEALTQLGTVQLGWLPDKGDLIVHRLELLRGGRVIDLLADGARYEILRREERLEQRSIDGSLTAALAVPRIEVGDVLRYSQTITSRDQALDGEVQSLNRIVREPSKAGFGRMLVSWPKDVEVNWQAGPDVTLAPPKTEGGYKVLELSLPIAKRDDMPQDAPSRFTRTTLLQAGTFPSWERVSQTMAPHFSTVGAVTPGGSLEREIIRIRARSRDPKQRAALALQVVQDEIAYLLNGMNGGNYLPQRPELTWEKKFGDCKAKSMLLLAMLRELGIDAEPVLVHSTDGDTVPELLPMPAAFDHVIIHAVIGGEDYWLDGTSAGTRIDTMDEVPAFRYALPVREGGSGLIAMPQRWPDNPDRNIRLSYDYSAGIDLPAVFDARIELRGIMGSQIRPQASVTDRDDRIAFASKYIEDLFPAHVVIDSAVTYDNDSGVGTMILKGLSFVDWEFERARGELALDTASAGIEFNPDRTRKAWRDIPFVVGGPFAMREEVTYILPDKGEGFDLLGLTEVDELVAGWKVNRSATIAGERVEIIDQAAQIPAEIGFAQFGTEKAKAARLRSGDLKLRSPQGGARYWSYPPKDSDKRLAKLEQAFADLIAVKPDEAWRYSLRGYYRTFYPDLAEAIADYDTAIELEPTADRYSMRARSLHELGKLDAALDDARIAYDLDPNVGTAAAVANILAEEGEFDEALALLDGLDLSGDDRRNVLLTKAEIAGEAGKLEDGWGMLEEALLDRPGDWIVLNSQCWYMGTWNYSLDDAADTCKRAVESSEFASSVLDSRALVYYRLGRTEDAIADLKASLARIPNQASSLYLQGVIRLEHGDKAGRKDIAEALRISSLVGRRFARYGIEPPA